MIRLMLMNQYHHLRQGVKIALEVFVGCLASSLACQTTFSASAALINPTFHAVHLLDSLLGFGIVPFLTPLQQDAAEMPYRPFNTGNRINALLGRWSKLARASGIA